MLIIPCPPHECGQRLAPSTEVSLSECPRLTIDSEQESLDAAASAAEAETAAADVQKELNSEIARLKAALDSKEEAAATARADFDGSKADVAALKMAVESLKAEAAAVTREKAELETTIGQLKAALATAESSGSLAAKDSAASLAVQAGLEAKVAGLQEALAVAEQARQDAVGATNTAVAAAKGSAALEAEVVRLKGSLASVQALHETEAAHAAQLRGQLQHSEAEKKVLAARVEQLAQQERDHASRLTQLKAETDEERERMGKERRMEQEEAAKTRQALEDRLSAIAAGEGDAVREMSAQLAAAEDARTLACREASKLSAEIEAANADSSRLTEELQSEKSKHSEEKDLLMGAKAKAEGESARLQSLVTEAEQRLVALEMECDEAKRQCHTLKEDHSHIEMQLNAERSALRANDRQLEEANGLVQELRSQVSMLGIERTGLQQQLEVTTAEFRQLRLDKDRLEQAGARTETAEAQTRLLAAEAADLRKRDAEKEAHRKELLQEVKRQEMLVNLANADADKMRKEVEALKKTNEELEEKAKTSGRNKHEDGYQAVVGVAALKAQLAAEAVKKERSGDADLLQGTNAVKLEVARRELNRMRTMVLMPILEEMEELKLHIVSSEDDLKTQLRYAISDRDAAQRAEQEADLRWGKSAAAIQHERDRCVQLQAALASLKDGSKSLYVEAGSLLQVASELMRHERSLITDLAKSADTIEALEKDALTLRADCEQLRKDSVELKLQLKENHRLHDAATSVISELEAEKASLTTKVEQLQGLAAEAERVAAERAAAQAALLAEKVAENQSLTSELEKLAHSITQHQGRTADLESRLMSTEQELMQVKDNFGGSKEEVVRLRELQANLQQQLSELKKARDQALATVATKETELRSVQSLVKEASQSVHRECCAFESQLATTRNEIIAEGAEMFAQLAELHALAQRRQDSLKEIEKQLAGTQEERSNARAECLQLSQVKARHEQRIAELETKLTKTEEEHEHTKSKTAALETTNSEVEGRLSAAQKELLTLQQDHAQKKDQIVALDAELQKTASLLATSQKERQHAVDKLTATAERMQEDVLQLQANLQATQKQAAEKIETALQEQHEEAERRLRQAEEDAGAARQKLEESLNCAVLAASQEAANHAQELEKMKVVHGKEVLGMQQEHAAALQHAEDEADALRVKMEQQLAETKASLASARADLQVFCTCCDNRLPCWCSNVCIAALLSVDTRLTHTCGHAGTAGGACSGATAGASCTGKL